MTTLTALHAQTFTISRRRRRALDKLIKYQEVRSRDPCTSPCALLLRHRPGCRNGTRPIGYVCFCRHAWLDCFRSCCFSVDASATAIYVL